ncbi:unnamed protein product [Linum trigynum]|uniref:Uncharacterized protein n=1 Tax=Linum trigynum TaxID=586398 RepID=A0AAV2C7N5_9ROSI
MKRFMSKKREFSGWGSKVLVEFLASIGKDTSQQLSQHEVAEIIKRYAAENNLFDPEKKKKIVCDAKLFMFFGRKSVNKNRILGHLTKHFADNQSDDDLDLAEEDWFVADDEDDVQVTNKKPRTSEAVCRDKVAAVPIVRRSCFASVTTENMKLLFLKRRVVEELSKDSENFDAKIIGSFVRVKANPYDYTQKNSHLLVQVGGVRRQIEESTGSILLQLSDMMGEMPICKLSDDNFTEEECEDLRQRVKNGLLKRPVIVEFEEKARALHEAITNDWIQRELVILKRLRDQASLKGWRRELAEYIERLVKLQTPEEKSRLLQEIPEVVADEEEVEPASEEIFKDEHEVVTGPEIALRFSRGSRIIWCPTDPADIAGHGIDDSCPSGLTRCARLSDKEDEGREEKSRKTKTDHQGDEVGDINPSGLSTCLWSDKENKSREEKSNTTKAEGEEVGDHCPPGLARSFRSDKEGKNREDNKTINTKTDCQAELHQQSGGAAFKTRYEGMLEIQNQEAAKKEGLHQEAMHKNNVYHELLSSSVEIVHLSEPDDAISASNPDQWESSKQPNKHLDQGKKQQQHCAAAAAANVVLIDLSDDDEDVDGDGKQQSTNPMVSSKQKIDVNARVWNCMNPNGAKLEGPYSMFMLKQWKDTSTGPYVAQFRVWREGQSREEAILLGDAISQAYGPNL